MAVRNIFFVCAVVVCISFFTVFIFFSTPHTLSTSPQKSEFEQAQLDIRALLGDAVDDENQRFEDLISDLLFITTDDIHRHGFGVRNVDMASRQEYFTDRGWVAYQDYIFEHKRLLADKSEEPLNAKSHFVYGSQQYEQDGDSKVFRASGTFMYAKYDAYSLGKKFGIYLAYSVSDIQLLSDLKIDQWEVQIQDLE